MQINTIDSKSNNYVLNQNQTTPSVDAGVLEDAWRQLQAEIFGSQFDVENADSTKLQNIKDLMNEALIWADQNPNNAFSKTIQDRVDMLNHALNQDPIYVNGVRLDPRDAFNRAFSNLQTSINCLTLNNPSLVDQTPYEGLVAR